MNIPSTLKEYLSIDGVHFEQFILKMETFDFDDITCSKLEKCFDDFKSTKNLDFKARERIATEIKTVLETFISTSTSKSSLDLFTEYIKTLDKCCFQGGFGHAVSYDYDSKSGKVKTYDVNPHHWVVKPELFSHVYPIPDLVELSRLINNITLQIKTTPAHERWGN